MKYSIYYSSLTGNTKFIAEKINEILNEKVLTFKEYNYKYKDNGEDIVFVGFWTDKGNADEKAKDLLSKIKNKNIVLFGTAGFMSNKEYYDNIINNVKKNIDESCNYIDYFLCQGKMDLSVRKRYEKMLEENPDNKGIKNMIENFDIALDHPNDEDIENLKLFLKKYK